MFFTEPPWSTQHQVDLVSWEDKSITLTQPPSDTFRNIITSLLNRLITPYTKDPEPETVSTKSVPADKSNQLLHKLLTDIDSTSNATPAASSAASVTDKQGMQTRSTLDEYL